MLIMHPYKAVDVFNERSRRPWSWEPSVAFLSHRVTWPLLQEFPTVTTEAKHNPRFSDTEREIERNSRTDHFSFSRKEMTLLLLKGRCQCSVLWKRNTILTLNLILNLTLKRMKNRMSTMENHYPYFSFLQLIWSQQSVQLGISNVN